MSRKIRSTLAVLTLWALVASAAHALPLAPRPAGLFDSLQEWIAARLAGLTLLRAKEGGDMDPNGTKAGSDMDPDGAPRLQSLVPCTTGEAGCDMDPNG